MKGLEVYLQQTIPVHLIVSYPFSDNNLRDAISDLSRKHIEKVKNMPSSRYKNYLQGDPSNYLPLREALQRGLISEIYDEGYLTYREILKSSHRYLQPFDCIYFNSGNDAETVYVHQARLMRIYSIRKQQEINQELKLLKKKAAISYP